MLLVERSGLPKEEIGRPLRRSKIVNLQILRAIAAVLVVYAHAIDLAQKFASDGYLSKGNLENLGAVGVDIFFVISGFIITRSAFSASRPSWRIFVWSRFTRVAPIYYLMSLPWVAMLALKGKLSIGILISSFLFWPAVTHSLRLPALSVGWTLWFEMLFYLSSAFVLAIKARRALGLLICLYFSSWILRLWTGSPVFQFLGNPIIIEFLFGVAIALTTSITNRPIAMVLGGAGLFLIGSSAYFGYGDISEVDRIITGELSLLRVLIWGVPSALLVLGALGAEGSFRVGTTSRFLCYLGDASYSIYLVHKLVFVLIERTLPEDIQLNQDVIIIGGCFLAVTVGVLVYHFVERKLLRVFKVGERDARRGRGLD